jgi:hypothetical protein
MKFILVRWISAVELSIGLLPNAEIQDSGFIQLCQNIEMSRVFDVLHHMARWCLRCLIKHRMMHHHRNLEMLLCKIPLPFNVNLGTKLSSIVIHKFSVSVILLQYFNFMGKLQLEFNVTSGSQFGRVVLPNYIIMYLYNSHLHMLRLLNVKVWHFVSDSHRFMTALIVMWL